MNYVLVFRPEVRKELDEAYSWYESQELGLGDDFLEQVDVTTGWSGLPKLISVVAKLVGRHSTGSLCGWSPRRRQSL